MQELEYWNLPKINHFYRGELGKLYLKLCHFFGYKLHIWQSEELTYRLPTHYSDTDHYLFDESPEWIVSDVKEQILIELQRNKKLEFRCRHTGYIRVFWQENDWTSSKVFMYQEGQLFDHKESFIRHSKINQLLNEN